MRNTLANREIFVYSDWRGIDGPKLMGMLCSERIRGQEVFSFEYDEDWLKSGSAQLLDPDLHLYTGPQYLNIESKKNFGLFLDSSPDRWGRVLMRRKEAALARKEGYREKNLFETDYLLGVYDQQRIGGLRFKEDPAGPFMNDSKDLSIPPWTTVRDLEEISLRLESNDIIDDPEYDKWLNVLIAPGSSLGGARPKAGIKDKKGNLWIAKFPSANDDFNVGAWEMLTMELAANAGLNVPESMAKKLSSHHHTFFSKRFDRTMNGGRIHYASAMTMLSYSDGQSYKDGLSYLELAEFLIRNGAEVTKDLHELWRRIVFNICVSNVDDHLRNHGFILTSQGWILSPAFDMNPVETGKGLKLNISENDNSLDLGLAMSVSEYFMLKKPMANSIIKQVLESVKTWKEIAKKYNLSRQEIELKAKAFFEKL